MKNQLTELVNEYKQIKANGNCKYKLRALALRYADKTIIGHVIDGIAVKATYQHRYYGRRCYSYPVLTCKVDLLPAVDPYPAWRWPYHELFFEIAYSIYQRNIAVNNLQTS